MAKFDRDVLAARAMERLRKASKAGRKNAELIYDRELTSIEGLTTLITWCNARFVDVVIGPGSDGVYDEDTRTIQISSKLALETQLHVLLHECGHMLIKVPREGERYSHGYSEDDPNVRRSAVHRVDVLDEELEAWSRGWKLAAKLEVQLDETRFMKTRTKFIKTYAKWVLNGDKGPAEDKPIPTTPTVQPTDVK